MKNYSNFNAFKCFFQSSVLLAMMIGCKPAAKVEVSNEVPATTASQEALASFNKGIELVDVNNGQQARIHFSKAIELDSTFASAYLYRSFTSPSLEQFKSDTESAAKHLDGKSDGEKIMVDLNKTFLSNNTEERMNLAQKLVAAYPKSARALATLADTYGQINDPANARITYQKVIELDSTWVGGYFSLGTSLMTVEPKDFKKAKENFEKVVALKPELPGSYIGLGDVYRALNELEKARDAYNTALQKDPNDGLTYLKLGHVNSFLGAFEDARSDYRKAAEVQPDNKVGSTFFEAFTYLYAGDPKTARTWLEEKANSLDKLGIPASQTTYAKYQFIELSAIIAFHVKEAPEVSRLVEQLKPISVKAGEENGTGEQALREKSHMLVWDAFVLAMKGDYSKAVGKAEEAKATAESLKNPTKHQEYHFAMGYISFKQGKFEDAIAHLDQADKNDPYNNYWLAQACDKGGQADRARKIFGELADYNFNAIGYALIRKELKEKMKPV